MFTFKEVVEALIKQQGLHEGIWSLNINFGLKATNVGETENDLKPSAIIPVMAIGLQRIEKENNLSADASKVNPRPHKSPR